MRKRVHMCLSVRGALRKTNRQLSGWISNDEGRVLSGKEAREALMDELAQGHEVVPCCAQEECPNFDYTGGGCPGHVVEDEGHRSEGVTA